MRRSVALAALTVAVAVLAACGGSKAKRLSRDAYVSEADAACTTAAHEQRKLASPTSIAGIPAYVDRALPILDTLVKDVRELSPPQDLEASVTQWLDLTAQGRKTLESLRAAAKRGDEQQVRQVSAKGTDLNQRRAALARSIGLTVCATT